MKQFVSWACRQRVANNKVLPSKSAFRAVINLNLQKQLLLRQEVISMPKLLTPLQIAVEVAFF